MSNQEVVMVSIVSLWLPILLSAVFVFIASSIIHMVLPFHWKDFSKAPKEDALLDALRSLEIPPGEYIVPHCATPKDMKDPAFLEKRNKGPIAFMTVMPGNTGMAGSLAGWFVFCIVVSVIAAYVAGRALGPGVHYAQVFRFVGCTAFVGYTLALWQNTIWYKRRVSTTLKSNVDGLVYALLTAGTFGWLWPA
jgi:Flp pilus assembly protein TadB